MEGLVSAAFIGPPPVAQTKLSTNVPSPATVIASEAMPQGVTVAPFCCSAPIARRSRPWPVDDDEGNTAECDSKLHLKCRWRPPAFHICMLANLKSIKPPPSMSPLMMTVVATMTVVVVPDMERLWLTTIVVDIMVSTVPTKDTA